MYATLKNKLRLTSTTGRENAWQSYCFIKENQLDKLGWGCVWSWLWCGTYVKNNWGCMETNTAGDIKVIEYYEKHT